MTKIKDKLFPLIKFFLGWPISIIALFFIVKLIIPQFSTILANFKQLTILPLIFGVICFLLYNFIRSYLWQRLLREKGYNIPFKEACFLWETAEIKRYIPGNIWSFLGKGLAFSQKGVDKKIIAQLLLFEIEFFLLGSAIVSLFSIPFILQEVFNFRNYLWIITLSSAIIVFAISTLFIFSKNILGKVHLLPDFSPLTKLAFLSISSLSLIFFGLGTYLVIASVVFLSLKFILSFIGFFVLSLFVGYISFITPMGLGVREGTITIGLAKILTSQIAGFVAIYSRIILIISELLFFILTAVWRTTKNKLFLKIENFIKGHSHEVILVSLILIYIFYFTTASFLRFDNFFTGRFDLGNMDQTVWNTLNGRIFELTNPNGTNITSRLAFHADFILILLAPLYFIWSNPKMLLLIQSIILGFGAIFVYLLSKDVLKNKNLSLVFSFVFLINPALGFVNLYDFHPVALATTFLLAAFYFLKKQKYIWFLIFLLLASLTKEDVWIITAIFGLYIFFIEKRKLLGTGVTIISVAIFYYLIWYAIPQALGGQHFALSYYSDFGNSPASIIRNIVFSPQKTLSIILQKKQMLYLSNLFSPLGFLSILSPITLIFAIPSLLINLLSNQPQFQEIYYQYSSNITPFLFISAIFGVKNLLKWLPKISVNFFIFYITFVSILFAYLLGPLPSSRNPNINMFIKQYQDKEIIDDFLSSIPPKFSIAATNNLGSHLSHRQKIFTIPVGIDKADIIAFLLNDPFAQPSLAAQKEIVKKMQKDKNYIEVFKHDNFIVFEKRNLYLEKGPKKINQVKLFPLSIPSLASRSYQGGKITIEKKVKSSGLFSSYIVSYPSDGLKIYALMNVPNSKKPKNGYPVLIINHGYINPKYYDTVNSYKSITDYFSSLGFLVLKPDYRGNGKSEVDNKALMRFAYPIDVMNLIESVKNINGADKNKIYMWGHSMGGEVTLEVLEIIGKNPELAKNIKAAVLWAPVTDPLKWFAKSHISQLEEATIRPFPYTQTFKILGTPDKNPQLWQSLSPLSYLSYIQAPVQINHGTSDENVPYEWSIELFNDLKSLNKQVKFYLYPGNDHNMQPSQYEALENSLAFFRSH